MAPDLLFYDGTCGLCHRAVAFVLRHDAGGSAFQVAPLQGETYIRRLDPAQRANLPDSLVVLTGSGALHVQSAGVVRVLRRLGGVWRVAGDLLWLIPRPVRDLIYEAVAQRRSRWFTRPVEACPRVPQELRNRFLP